MVYVVCSPATSKCVVFVSKHETGTAISAFSPSSPLMKDRETGPFLFWLMGCSLVVALCCTVQIKSRAMPNKWTAIFFESTRQWVFFNNPVSFPIRQIPTKRWPSVTYTNALGWQLTPAEYRVRLSTEGRTNAGLPSVSTAVRVPCDSKSKR